MVRVSEYATLNANYMAAKLKKAGFELAYPDRRATHEFIVTLRKQAKNLDVNAMDFASACSTLASTPQQLTSQSTCPSVS